LAVPRDTWKAWDTAANRHLTAYLMTHSTRLFPDAAYDGARREVVVGPLSRENELILRSFRDAWAEDMRAGPVPEDQGISMWADCMDRAEAEIARRSGASSHARVANTGRKS
jgi:hypothetical protein